MMTSNTFVYALKIVHDALYKLDRPVDSEQFRIIKQLINGYISLLGNLDDHSVDMLNNYLLENKDFDESKAMLLFDYLVEGEHEVKH